MNVISIRSERGVLICHNNPPNPARCAVQHVWFFYFSFWVRLLTSFHCCLGLRCSLGLDRWHIWLWEYPSCFLAVCTAWSCPFRGDGSVGPWAWLKERIKLEFTKRHIRDSSSTWKRVRWDQNWNFMSTSGPKLHHHDEIAIVKDGGGRAMLWGLFPSVGTTETGQSWRKSGRSTFPDLF